MNYSDQQLRRMLTAEYALGTLRGAARRRFETLLEADAGLRVELVFWETRLAQLGLDLAPVTPDPRVWAAIERRIGGKTAPPKSQTEHEPWWRNLNLWRGTTALAAVAAVALAIILWLTPGAPSAPPTEFVSVIMNKQKQPAWLFIVVRRGGVMSVTAMPGTPKIPQGKDMQLWIMPGNGKAPVAIALMPRSGAYTAKISPHKLTMLKNAQSLAVSLEPKGGSPTGRPTGPMLFTARVVANL